MTTTAVRLSKQRRTTAYTDIEQSPQLEEIMSRLETGDSFDSVARWLVKSAPKFKGRQDRTLGKQLARWWRDHAGAVRDNLAQKRAAEIAEVTRLEELYAMQMKRVKMLTDNEATIKTLFPGGRQEIAEAKNLLHLIIDKKQSLGLYEKADAPVSVTHIDNSTNVQTNIAVRMTDKVNEVLADQKSRRRILAAVTQITKPQRTVDEAREKQIVSGTRGTGGETIDVMPVAATG